MYIVALTQVVHALSLDHGLQAAKQQCGHHASKHQNKHSEFPHNVTCLHQGILGAASSESTAVTILRFRPADCYFRGFHSYNLFLLQRGEAY